MSTEPKTADFVDAPVAPAAQPMRLGHPLLTSIRPSGPKSLPGASIPIVAAKGTLPEQARADRDAVVLHRPKKS